MENQLNCLRGPGEAARVSPIESAIRTAEEAVSDLHNGVIALQGSLALLMREDTPESEKSLPTTRSCSSKIGGRIQQLTGAVKAIHNIVAEINTRLEVS